MAALVGAGACGAPPDAGAPDAGTPDAGALAGLTPELRIAVDASLDHLAANAGRLGLGGRGDLALVRAFVDELDLTHARFQQTVGGVPVFGGEGIVHLGRDRAVSRVTDAFVPGIAVSTTPKLSADEAIARALPPGTCATCLATPPRSELWAMRHEGRDHLVWRVQLRLDEGTNRISLPVVFVDAHDGSLVWQYDNLQTGTGPSLYSGPLTFDTTPSAGTYFLEDLPHRLGTFDMRNGSTLYRFDDPDDVWDAASQRAGIDAHHGARMTYDYFKTVHGRDGIDGNGGPGSQLAVDGTTPLVTSRVHYGTSYNNAFWDGTRMTYGDGNGVTFSPLVTLDVAGHEMMHGITQFTAGLVYAGESGALNESYSDVFGAMVERYARGESEAIWKIGDECYTPATPGDALRHMDAPHQASNKGYTADDDPDHYSERYTGSSDNGGVHINSGIPNKAFYLLAMGGAHHLGGSMTGIGADRAAAIWYKALTAYMTSTTGFVAAARATYDAAVALYGEDSPEAAAVVSAWGLTGVFIDLAAPQTAITAPADGATVVAPMTITASATDDVGVTAVEFLIDGAVAGTDTTAPFSHAWNTHASGPGPHTLASRAFDAVGNSTQSAAITVTVEHEAVPPAVAITAPADGATVGSTVTVTADATDNVGVIRVELLVDGALVATDTAAPWELPWDSTTSVNGAHVLVARAFDAVGNTAASAPVAVTSYTPGLAAYDPVLRAPRCATPGSVCDTGGLVNGRGGVGPEPNAPNTLGGTCADGTAGTYHGSQSLDRLRVYTYDGLPIAAGKPIIIVASAWVSYDYFDRLDLYHTATPEAPVWTYLGTVSPWGNGAQTLSKVVTLPPGTQHAIRGQLRYSASQPAGSPCNTSYTVNDRDDLVFAAIDAPDTAPPSASITAPAAGGEFAGAVEVTATATDDLGVTGVELHVDGVPVETDTMAPYGFWWNTATVADGPHTLTVRAIDPSGKVGDSAPVEITTNNDDVTPPTALLLQPSASVTVKGVYNVLAAAGDDLGLAALEVYVDGVLIETTTSSSHYFPWDTTSVPNGARTLQARARDGAGNVGLSAPVTVTVNNPDVTAPVASIASPAAGSTVSGAIQVIADASDGVGVTRVDLLVDGLVAQYRTAAPYTFTWDTAAKPNGVHTLQARARDAAGNLGYSATSSVTVANVDTTPPAVSITSPANGSVVSGTRNVAIPATDLNGVAAVELYLDGVKLVTDTASPYTFAWSTGTVPNGPHVLQARAFDAAGNAGQSAPVAVTVNNPDYTAPTTAILSPAAGEVVAGTITVTTSSSDNIGVTSVELLRAGVVIATATSAPWSLTWDTTAFADGVHTIRTRARDAAGNIGLSPNRSIIVDN